MSASPVETKPSSSVEIIMSDRPVESMSSAFPAESCTVFWDVMDYPFPEGLDPDLIYPRMKSILEDIGCRGAVLIKAYVDKDEWLDKKVADGITIVPIQGDNYSRGLSMFVDIAFWATINRTTPSKPLGFMVISEQIKEVSAFFPFCIGKAFSNYHVCLTVDDPTTFDDIFLTPDGPPPNMLHTVRFDCLSRTLQG